MRFKIISLLSIIIFLLYASHYWTVSDELTVKFLDIGQGDSILIDTPNGRRILVDGGPGTTILERLGEETSFWQRSFDLVVLTHPDLDHLEGLLEIMKRYEVQQVLMTGVLHSSALYREFRNELKGVPISIANPKIDWHVDEGVWLDILSPLSSVEDKQIDNLNNSSIVMKLVFGKTSLLLSGDMEKDAEHSLLMTDANLMSDVLKVSHHGSVTGSSTDFLRAVSPDLAIIQSGLDNDFGHPHTETLLRLDELGIEWLNTSEEGTIRIISNGSEWVLG